MELSKRLLKILSKAADLCPTERASYFFQWKETGSDKQRQVWKVTKSSDGRARNRNAPPVSEMYSSVAIILQVFGTFMCVCVCVCVCISLRTNTCSTLSLAEKNLHSLTF